MPDIVLAETRADLRCPVCSCPLEQLPSVTCGECETPAHVDCWEFSGGCARFACRKALTPRTRVTEYLVTMRKLAAIRTVGVLGFTAPIAIFILALFGIQDPVPRILVPMVGLVLSFALYVAPMLMDIRALRLGTIRPDRRMELLRLYDSDALELVYYLVDPRIPDHPYPFAMAFAKGTVGIGLLLCLTTTKLGVFLGLVISYLGIAYAMQVWATQMLTELDRPAARLATRWLAELEKEKKETKSLEALP